MKLPALRSLNQLADQEPMIVVDTREQEPLVFKSLQAVRGTLLSGDYSVAGLEELFSVERKSNCRSSVLLHGIKPRTL
jgi:hypothetical protein